MRRTIIVLGIVCVFAMAAGCAQYRAPVIPPQGFAFTQVGAPLSTQFNESTAVAPKQGKASAVSVLGLVAFGDASLQEAAREGDLRTIHYADYEYLNVLFGMYTSFTVIVHGE